MPDKTVLPGSQSATVAGVPQAPILQTATTSPPTPKIPLSNIPKPPPTPAQASANPPLPSTNTGNLPPTGTGTAATGPTSAPPPRRPRRRFRNFLLSLIILGTLGYAGGVYYSLVNDNFHDFFTEYIPYGEDAVAYFEDREFRRRFPSKEYNAKTWPQTRGEQKVVIGRSSGLQPRVAGEDLGEKGRHVSALEDNAPKAAQVGKAEGTKAVESAKKEAPPTKKDVQPPPNAVVAKEDAKKPATPSPAPSKPTQPSSALPPTPAAPAVSPVDHLNVAQATEPAVQDLVKMVNNIITAVNASPEAAKLVSTVQNMKSELGNVISSISTLKDQSAAEAESKISSAHQEFDVAAKELVRRLEQEMREQETKWRDEYEVERQKLSDSYQQKLAAELDAAKKIAEETKNNELLQKEIQLQKQHMETVKSKVEEERSGRLAKLDQLSTSVSELNNLTSEWNSVVDATLSTQHLQVALEAVRAKVLDSNVDVPVPFLNELVALKEVSKSDDLVSAAIASIPPVAYQRGIPTPAHLIDRFRRVAAEVRKASLLPEDAGIASHAASAVLSRFMFTKKSDRGLPEGEDVEATLARSEVLLEEGDLDAAAREMNALQGWAGVLSRDWVGECRRVLEVRQAVEVSFDLSLPCSNVGTSDGLVLVPC